MEAPQQRNAAPAAAQCSERGRHRSLRAVSRGNDVLHLLCKMGSVISRPGAKDSPAPKKGAPGPLLGTTWWVFTVGGVAFIASRADCTAYHIPLGYRSAVAMLGYLTMQIGLWNAEFRWVNNL